MLASAALVLFMTPGLALFYGGMVRAKHVLGMLMQNFFAMGLVSVLWAVIGFTLAFGTDLGGGLLGGLDHLGLAGLTGEGATVP
ncbi:MAG: ammonium transporter, partial [Egibacteraceae bacterium]